MGIEDDLLDCRLRIEDLEQSIEDHEKRIKSLEIKNRMLMYDAINE